MITVISGTNRKNSECLEFARLYCELLRQKTDEEVKLLAMEEIDYDWIHPDMYATQSPSLSRLQDEYLLHAEKIVYITPEYNGSFPGVLKLFLDACSVRAYKATFKGKKAALVGVATGRAGNLRGMDHLTDVLHHLGTIVLPNKLPISRIRDLQDEGGEIIDPATIAVMEQHVVEFLGF
ncbi:MAG TPA: NADPH-dependent FMN reductase [Saprospiraceae bacterium]|nr:NADPH-dependent FMN reductase [Saprospiraceae bacterium]HMQ82120.1 NADPH-dependent FMN reductase [Saprospiraceae bacterium]